MARTGRPLINIKAWEILHEMEKRAIEKLRERRLREWKSKDCPVGQLIGSINGVRSLIIHLDGLELVDQSPRSYGGVCIIHRSLVL